MSERERNEHPPWDSFEGRAAIPLGVTSNQEDQCEGQVHVRGQLPGSNRGREWREREEDVCVRESERKGNRYPGMQKRKREREIDR